MKKVTIDLYGEKCEVTVETNTYMAGGTALLLTENGMPFSTVSAAAFHPQLRSNLGGGEAAKIHNHFQSFCFSIIRTSFDMSKGIYPHTAREYFLVSQ